MIKCKRDCEAGDPESIGLHSLLLLTLLFLIRSVVSIQALSSDVLVPSLEDVPLLFHSL